MYVMELEEMEAVVVNSRRRTKYSNKNNPAVDLIRKVVDNRDRNRMSASDYLTVPAVRENGAFSHQQT